MGWYLFFFLVVFWFLFIWRFRVLREDGGVMERVGEDSEWIGRGVEEEWKDVEGDWEFEGLVI